MKKFIAATVVVLGLAAVFLGILFYSIVSLNLDIPQISDDKYFPEGFSTISGTLWRINYIQPFYRGYYQKDNQWFLRVAFRDSTDKIRQTKVLLGFKNKRGSEVTPSFSHDGGEYLKLTATEILENIKKGDQIRVEYLSKFQQTSPSLNICFSVQYMCDIAQVAKGMETMLFNFTVFHIPPTNKAFFLPAVTISKLVQ